MNVKTLLSSLFIFAAGAAIGSAVTWRLLKTKYEQLANEEIESYTEALKAMKKRKSYTAPAATEVSIQDYEKVVREAGYKEVNDVNEPYVIPPEDYGENDDYDTETLYYYADNVLADDQNQIIEDVDDVVGSDSLTHFGEYEDDSVFVRNDRVKTDYEILLDPSNYSDIVNSSPHQPEDE